MKKHRSAKFIDAKLLPLDAWIGLVMVPKWKRDYKLIDYSFPTDNHREEYLSIVHSRSEDEVRQILRGFLIENGHLGQDENILLWLINATKEGGTDPTTDCEFLRRLLTTRGAWEGSTWVLDLLPDHPNRALDVLKAYFFAHAQFLPDGRLDGLADAEAIIRQRYFHQDNPRDVLVNLRPTDFEYLVAALYARMGYDISVTPASRDGGIDVIARMSESGKAELILFQCKKYASRVPVASVRELGGVVSMLRANKGVIVSTSDFTSPAKSEAGSTSRIELLGFKELNVLMNKHFGTRWPNFVTYHIREVQRRFEKNIFPSPGD